MGTETLVPIPKIHQGIDVITDFQQFNPYPNADDLGERDLLILLEKLSGLLNFDQLKSICKIEHARLYNLISFN
jgi:hypothetical protein